MTTGESDHPQTVRVEVEGVEPTQTSDPSADGIEKDGSPKWVVALAIVLVGVVGAVVLSLQPDDNTAAGENEREDAESDLSDRIEVPDRSETSGGGLVPTRLLIDTPVIDIARTEEGFFALSARPGATPTIFRSTNGEDWFESNTTVARLDGRVGEPLNWFALDHQGSSFFLRGEAPSTGLTNVFVSNDGGSWSQVPGLDGEDPGGLPITPVAFTSDSVFTYERISSRLRAQVLTDHTTFEVPAAGVCGVGDDVSETGEQLVSIIDCVGNIESLDARQIVGPATAPDVFGCLTEPDVSVPFQFVRHDAVDERAPLPLLDLRPMGLPLTLPDGRIAMPDAGRSALPAGSCEGLVQQDSLAPGIVLVDAETTEVTRWPFPSGTGVLEGGRSPHLSGSYELGSGESVIVVELEDELWLLETTTGDWTSLSTDLLARFVPGATLIVSASNVLVLLGDGQLTTIDLPEDRGALSEVDTNSEVTTPIDTRGVNDLRFGGGILYADNQRVIFSDSTNIWEVEPPERGE